MEVLTSFKLLWKPFDAKFGDTIDNFRRHRDVVEKEAELSHMIEAAGERNAQREERAIIRVERDTEEAARKGKHDVFGGKCDND